MNDAASWLSSELLTAQKQVDDCESHVANREASLRMAQHWLANAHAKVEMLELIITSSGLQHSAKPADTATIDKKGSNVAQTDDD